MSGRILHRPTTASEPIPKPTPSQKASHDSEESNAQPKTWISSTAMGAHSDGSTRPLSGPLARHPEAWPHADCVLTAPKAWMTHGWEFMKFAALRPKP